MFAHLLNMQKWSALRGVASQVEGGEAFSLDLNEVSAVSRSAFRHLEANQVLTARGFHVSTQSIRLVAAILVKLLKSFMMRTCIVCDRLKK